MTEPRFEAADEVPVRGLAVLSDPACPLCRHLKSWLERQVQLVPLEFVPVGSAEARRRFPGLDHRRTEDEITVVGDSGQVWEGEGAWIAVLWALDRYRPLAHRLAATPTGQRVARAAVLGAAKWRHALRAGPAAQGTAGPCGGDGCPVPAG